ncbi:MAG TPA: hypothetical protein VFD00_08410 [Thermoclostridium sp.]|nr:hypothetical protein [Thermoclostridium sp.]
MESSMILSLSITALLAIIFIAIGSSWRYVVIDFLMDVFVYLMTFSIIGISVYLLISRII